MAAHPFVVGSSSLIDFSDDTKLRESPTDGGNAAVTLIAPDERAARVGLREAVVSDGRCRPVRSTPHSSFRTVP